MKILKFQRASQKSGIVVDTHRLKVYVCECGAVVVDQYKHAQFYHKGIEKIEIVNSERGHGTVKANRNNLIEAGKKIKVIGAGKQ